MLATLLIHPIYSLVFSGWVKQPAKDHDNTIRVLTIAWQPCYNAIVIRSFGGRGTEDIFNGVSSKAARQTCPQSLWTAAARKLDMLNAAAQLKDLAAPPGNRLEPLRKSRKGQHSIRINDQYRICFSWTEGGPENVEITDYH